MTWPEVRLGFLQFLPSLAVLAAFLVLWQLLVPILRVPSFLLPTPSAIAAQLANPSIPWLRHTAATLYESMAGFALAAVLGIGLAVPMALWRRFSLVSYPFVVAAQVVPKMAFVPILFIWLGFGFLPRVVTVFLVCFFPIVVDTVAGLSSLGGDTVDMVRLHTRSRLDLFRRAMFPNALPSIFAGLKVAATLAVVGAVVSEFVSSSEGLGYLIISAQLELNTSLAFAAAAILVAVGFLIYAAVEVAERVLVPWRSESAVRR